MKIIWALYAYKTITNVVVVLFELETHYNYKIIKHNIITKFKKIGWNKY